MLSLRAGRRGITQEQQSGGGGAGERSERDGCISSHSVIVRLLRSEAPGADSNNPPEQGGDGVSNNDGSAVAERWSGRNRGRQGAVLLSQSGLRWI